MRGKNEIILTEQRQLWNIGFKPFLDVCDTYRVCLYPRYNDLKGFGTLLVVVLYCGECKHGIVHLSISLGPRWSNIDYKTNSSISQLRYNHHGCKSSYELCAVKMRLY